MKFGSLLSSSLFPEWSAYYIDYRGVKNRIETLFPTKKEVKSKRKIDPTKIKHTQYRY